MINMEKVLKGLVGKLAYDQQISRLVFIGVIFGSVIASCIGFSLVLATMEGTWQNYTFIAITLYYIISQFILIAILIITKWFQICFFMMLLNIVIEATAGHFFFSQVLTLSFSIFYLIFFFKPGGILAGSIIIFLPFVSELATHQGNNLQKVFWTIANICLIFAWELLIS